jgi:hypothetical protein
MPTRDRLARKTKQGATSIVNFGWHISIIKPVSKDDCMFESMSL